MYLRDARNEFATKSVPHATHEHAAKRFLHENETDEEISEVPKIPMFVSSIQFPVEFQL